MLPEENIATTWQGVEYRTAGTIDRAPGSGRLMKMTPAVKATVEERMRENDETTSKVFMRYIVKTIYMYILSNPKTAQL